LSVHRVKRVTDAFPVLPEVEAISVLHATLLAACSPTPRLVNASLQHSAPLEPTPTNKVEHVTSATGIVHRALDQDSTSAFPVPLLDLRCRKGGVWSLAGGASMLERMDRVRGATRGAERVWDPDRQSVSLARDLESC